jgi:cytochrome P450
LLTQHPEVEARLRDELAAEIGDRRPANDDLPRLTYTEQVLKETMRIYPPAYVFTRSPAARDVTLGGYRIKHREIIFISPWVLHRDPRWFERPDQFDPARWTPELTKRLPRTAFLPFSAGPRMCIGWEFAMMEMKLIVASIVPRFRLSRGSGSTPRPLPLVTLGFSGPISVRVDAA